MLYCDWRPDFEDRWSFTLSKKIGENNILFRLKDYDEKKDTDRSLSLIFEFVIIYRGQNNSLVEISSGWTSIEIINLKNKIGEERLMLFGGTPLKKMVINEGDVRTARTGMRAIFKGQIKSKLKIEIIQPKNIPAEILVNLMHYFIMLICLKPSRYFLG